MIWMWCSLCARDHSPGISCPLKNDVPAVVLINPKFAHNVGAALRACAAFGIPTLRWTGERVTLKDTDARLPREERLRVYAQAVEWARADSTRVLDRLGLDGVDRERSTSVPIAIELHKGAELLPTFEHPENAVYVFGPEDGSIPKAIRHVCHRFVVIPSSHCLNLAAAINVVLLRSSRETTAGGTRTNHDE